MNSRRRARLLQILPSIVLAVSNFGCGGSSSTFQPPTQISVAVSPATAMVKTSLTTSLTATISNDASNSGVSWTLSCSAVQCGTIAPLTTLSGAPTIYTTPATIPPNVSVTVTATSVADETKASSSTLIPVGYIPGYDVGVDPSASIWPGVCRSSGTEPTPTARQLLDHTWGRAKQRGAKFRLSIYD